MKRALFALGVALVFGSVSAAPPVGWKFSQSTDEMTDERTCRLDGPSKDVMLSFQGGKLYLVSGAPLTVDDIHLMTVRVDKLPARDVKLRAVKAPYLMAVDPGPELDELVRQFSSGSTYMLRTLSLSGIEDHKSNLTGFSAAYEKFKACESGL